MKEVHCKYCGKLFRQKYKTQQYCSVECKDKNVPIVNRKRLETEYYKNPKICVQCGKVIPYEHRSNTMFCGMSCKNSYSNSHRIISEEHKQKISKSVSERYANGDNRGCVERVCKVCGKHYYKTKHNGSTRVCCSKECSDYLLHNRKEFYSPETLEKMSERMRNNVLKLGDLKRSKNEVLFCKMCEEHFTNVENNKPIFNGWDADVIIHDIKVAVLWNGVWHRKKITKKHSVEQVKNRDNIKINEIIKCGYTPYVIDDDGKYNEDFVKSKFDDFIKYTKNI